MVKRLSTLLLLPIVVWVVRLLVALRYRLVVKGLDQFTSDRFKKTGGILFLPNHPAEVDPVILERILWPKFRPRPLVVEHFYYLKGFRFFMDLVGAMPLPTMDIMANKWRGKKVQEQFDNVTSALKKGDNFLIYPSGRLKHTGLERIGGASFVHDLLDACPETNVVLVRTTGLWGSKFSRALTGESPEFGKVLWECAKILLKNFIFFAPKREVLVELEFPPADFPHQANRLDLNKYLENWYNRYPKAGPEPIRLVSYAFWKEELPKPFVPSEKEKEIDERPVPQKIQDEVFAHLSKLSGWPVGKIERKLHLSHDLGLDSLDVAQLYVFLDVRYEIADLVPGDLQTVEDLLQAAAGIKKGEERIEVSKHRFHWPKEKRLPLQIAEGETIQEVFLKSVDRNKCRIACYDAISGALSYRKMKLAALVLADKFKALPGDKIGIMLPSTVGAYLTLLGVLLSGKVPVMINWTSGVKALDHAADLSQIKTVITSARFLDQLENGDLGKIEEMFTFLEDVRKSVTWKDKLRAFVLSLKPAEKLMKALSLKASPSDPAVILFTSGTEALPKGVPLSHFNILSNHRASIEAVKLLPDEILMGVLPPFHSFGFSVTGLYPLLLGMRVCYSPDPTDSHGLAREIGELKPTLFCCAPSFIKAVFQVAKPDQLQSLRIVVSGAEKTSQDIFDYAREHLPNTAVLEGYGITECSPVVTIDRLGQAHKGVGKPLPGLSLCVIDSDTQKILGVDQEGEVCIFGPSVFSGYLGSARNPFVEIDGKKWYASGDRGQLDKEGHLILSGRLKRFVKIGGEMVSLGGLEEELFNIARAKNWIAPTEKGPQLAVSVKESDAEKATIILYTTFAVSKEDINVALRESGMGRIVKIAEVRKLEQIPLTGTGKTHYRLLDEL